MPSDSFFISQKTHGAVIGFSILLLSMILGYLMKDIRILLILPLFLSGVFLVGKPNFVFVLIISLFASSFKLPMFPEDLQLAYFLIIPLAIILLAKTILSHKDISIGFTEILICFYAGILIYTTAARGFGLSILGSPLVGGTTLMIHLFSCLLFLLKDSIQLTKTQILWAGFFLCLLSGLRMAADLVFLFSSGTLGIIYLFIPLTYSSTINMFAGENLGLGMGVFRLQRAQFLAPFMFYTGVVIYMVNPRQLVKVCLGLFLPALFLALISGHRSAIFYIGLPAVFYYFYLVKMEKWSKLFLFLAVGLLSYVLLFAVAPKLPAAAQRMVSVLPGIQVDSIVKRNSDSTIDFRLNLWQSVAAEIPDYLWLGKGIMINVHEARAYSTLREYLTFYNRPQLDPFDVVIGNDYHNGFLCFIIDLGVPGLIVGTLLLWSLSWHLLFRHFKVTWYDPWLRAIDLAICIRQISLFIGYFMIYGNLRFVYEFMIMGTFLFVIRKCNRGFKPDTQTENTLSEMTPVL